MNRDTLLFRQIHPSFFKEGRVTSQAFRPISKSDNELSVYDGDQITAKDAWCHYVYELENKSTGVMAVTIAECHSQSLCPRPDPVPFPAHAVIDFGGLNHKNKKDVAKKLADFANSRDWQHGPVD